MPAKLRRLIPKWLKRESFSGLNKPKVIRVLHGIKSQRKKRVITSAKGAAIGFGVGAGVTASMLAFLVGSTSAAKGKWTPVGELPEAVRMSLFAGSVGALVGGAGSYIASSSKVKLVTRYLGKQLHNAYVNYHANQQFHDLVNAYKYVHVDRKGNFVFSNMPRLVFGRMRLSCKAIRGGNYRFDSLDRFKLKSLLKKD